MPIDIDRVEEFDPFTVPTISQICHEFEACADERRKGMNATTPIVFTSVPTAIIISPGYERTSLGGYMKTFSDFVKRLRASSGTVHLHHKKNQGSARDFNYT